MFKLIKILFFPLTVLLFTLNDGIKWWKIWRKEYKDNYLSFVWQQTIMN